jgi:anti-sigma28 factor (negative regulator of flagellin synthesis)
MNIIEQLIKSLEEAKAELQKSAKILPTSSNVVGIPAEKVKEAKIKNLQRQIDAGTYKPDPKKIADKMLKEELTCSENGQWKIVEKRC